MKRRKGWEENNMKWERKGEGQEEKVNSLPRTNILNSSHCYSTQLSGDVYNNSTSIRRPFDSHSTAYQRSSRSQRRNPLAAVTLTYSFI